MQTRDYFEFLNYPKIVSGQNALENIPSELDGYNAQKPLVITSISMVQRGLVKKFVKAFYDSTVVIGGIYDEIRNYAGISQAREAAQLYKVRGCDAIIALGNGPVVDLAKAVNILVSKNIDHLGSLTDGGVLNQPLKPLILVPACSFNGLEATNTMTVDNRRVLSDFLYPGVIFLDARITIGCCPECLAETGIIALSQAFEAMMGDTANPMIDAAAHPALSLLAIHLPQCVAQPSHREACLAVANAAIMAAAAYCNAGSGIAFMLGEALSRATDLSLGKLMPSILSAVVKTIQRRNSPIRDELLLAMAGLDRFAALPARERSRQGLNSLMALIQRLQGTLPVSLKELNIQTHILDKVAQEAAQYCTGRVAPADCYSILISAEKD